jgi:hypothetical protein
MKEAEQTIHLLAELLELTQYLRQLVIDHCRLLTSDQDGHLLEEDNEEERQVPF